MSSWHNALGEDGQRLTILSVLPRASSNLTGAGQDAELSLREAIDELFRIAGEDGHAGVVLNVTVQGPDGPEFTTEENVSLRDLADRLYGSYGADGGSASYLRVLTPEDDPWGWFNEPEPASDETDAGRSPLAALRRLREAVHRLYGGSVDQEVPPTVLSLLVGARPEDPS
jgi:hypothetical protein